MLRERLDWHATVQSTMHPLLSVVKFNVSVRLLAQSFSMICSRLPTCLTVVHDVTVTP